MFVRVKSVFGKMAILFKKGSDPVQMFGEHSIISANMNKFGELRISSANNLHQ